MASGGDTQRWKKNLTKQTKDIIGHIASSVELVQLDLILAIGLCRLLVEVEREVRGEVSMEELAGRSWAAAAGEEGLQPVAESSRQEPRKALESITAGQKTSCSLI